ncbi:MAG TPA: CvpA family protein [Arsenicitalea sp.]|jgi:membrane protein required for colicin V production|nr:CvpA family protein [Arsenicitalea sp.]
MLTAFDVGVGVLVLISAILATARGLTREVLSLVTWAGSAGIAAYMYFYHPDIAQGFIKDPTIAMIATIGGSFIIALIVLHLVTMRIADFVVDSRIGPLDRTLGFVFGVLRGILIAVVLVLFAHWLLPDTQKLPDWARDAKTWPTLVDMGDRLKEALPPSWSAEIDKLTKHGATTADETPPADTTTNDTAPPADNSTDSLENSTPPAADGTLSPTPPDANASPAKPAKPGANI